MRRREFLHGCFAPALLAGIGGSSAPAFAAEPVRAWIGATVWLGDGQVIEDATLVSSGERILALAKSAPVPSDAQVVQA